MATKTIEKELLSLEHRYWQALKNKDVKAALALTDEPCLVTGAQGVGSVDKRTYEQMMSDASWTIVDFEIDDDAQVRMLGNDTAILAYKVHEVLEVDGKPVTFDAADASTWVRRGGDWVCAMHTESILGDPYGRDRSQSRG